MVSIADQFPEYDLSLPSWLLNAPDEPFDPVDLARRASLEDLRALDPLAHAPSAVDLKLGGRAMESGAVNADVATLFGLFQDEVNAASDSDDTRWTTMRIVGSSRGSVILHLEPLSNEEEPSPDALEIPSGRTFDAALKRVLDLHDNFEEQRAVDIKEVKRPLRAAVRRFVEALDELDATVEASAYTAEGHRRRSALSRNGRQFAVTQFAPVESATVDLIFGELQSVDLTGTIVIKGRGGPRNFPARTTSSGRARRRAPKKFEIRSVPVEMIRSAALLPGRFYGVQVVDRTSKDPMQTKSRDDFEFVGLASLDEVPSELSGE